MKNILKDLTAKNLPPTRKKLFTLALAAICLIPCFAIFSSTEKYINLFSNGFLYFIAMVVLQISSTFIILLYILKNEVPNYLLMGVSLVVLALSFWTIMALVFAANA
ncbi:hypothetical protein [Shewanella chilikensis]|uniref:hypothetical protein n=1 Tax=Shewanella chilikensis TaxID=558541 RepID=UPI00399BBE2C